jgi:hypothetical protein
MKRFISNGMDVYKLITDENDEFYFCDNYIIPKKDVVTDYHVLDNMKGVLHVHVVPFYQW